MNNITVIGLDNKTQKVEFSDGDNLMELLRDAGYDEIIAMCGGCCSCATCHVHIADQEKFSLNPREEDEQNLVEMADHYSQNMSRLSCQISLTEDQSGMAIQIVEAE